MEADTTALFFFPPFRRYFILRAHESSIYRYPWWNCNVGLDVTRPHGSATRAGITEIPNESAVLSSMKSNIGDKRGLYIFPGLRVRENPSRTERVRR
jgi:hypothetical protein